MLITQLQKIGLSEKEAKIYLASLELGEETVQHIAKKAGINRPTTYVQIEGLIKKGLMSSVEKGKKRCFIASPPEQLLRLLDKKKAEIEEEDKDFKEVLPELKAIYNLVEERPRVRFFEGIEGLKAIQEDVLKTKDKFLEEVASIDPAYKLFPPRKDDHRQRMLKRGIKFKLIYTSKGEYFLPRKDRFQESLLVPEDKFSLPGELVIYGNKVALMSLRNKICGVIVENKEIADTLRSLFELGWETAKRYQK